MQKKILSGIVIVLIGMLMFASCAKDKVQYPAQPPIDTTLKVSFKDTIQPIFDRGCLGSFCHSGSVAPNLTAGKSYNDIVPAYVNTSTPNQSILYMEMKTGGGMSTHCTPDEANLVLTWITKGALNN
jgi:hypothetical protein